MGTIKNLRKNRKSPLQKWFHNHFVINSVSYKDGKRFHFCTDRMLELRQTSDRLCREHGLSIVGEPQGKAKSMYACRLERAGMPSRYSVARDAVDKAISRSLNIEEFKAELRQLGYRYQMSPSRKYWTVTVPGWKKPIRMGQLGEDYSKERILERIYENDESVRTEKFRKAMEYRANNYRLGTRLHKIRARTGFEKLYLRICYEMGYLPRYRQDPLKIHGLFKVEIEKCEKYAEEAKLICRNGIRTDLDLSLYTVKIKRKMAKLLDERDEYRKIVKRSIPETEKKRTKEQITKLTSEIKKLRHEVKLCEDIKRRSPELEQRVKKIDEERGTHKEVR